MDNPGESYGNSITGTAVPKRFETTLAPPLAVVIGGLIVNGSDDRISDDELQRRGELLRHRKLKAETRKIREETDYVKKHFYLEILKVAIAGGVAVITLIKALQHFM